METADEAHEVDVGDTIDDSICVAVRVRPFDSGAPPGSQAYVSAVCPGQEPSAQPEAAGRAGRAAATCTCIEADRYGVDVDEYGNFVPHHGENGGGGAGDGAAGDGTGDADAHGRNTFHFDHVFWSTRRDELDRDHFATQDDVFDAIGTRVAKQGASGFNCSVFAYGQTGSGKTHTMMGGDPAVNPQSVGLIPRIFEALLGLLPPSRTAQQLSGRALASAAAFRGSRRDPQATNANNAAANDRLQDADDDEEQDSDADTDAKGEGRQKRKRKKKKKRKRARDAGVQPDEEDGPQAAENGENKSDGGEGGQAETQRGAGGDDDTGEDGGNGENGEDGEEKKRVSDKEKEDKTDVPPDVNVYKVSFLEIYMERLHDLLVAAEPVRQPGAKPRKLKLREDPQTGPFVEGATKQFVFSHEDMVDLLERGQHRRATASTEMNLESSRSHAVFTIELTQKQFDVETETYNSTQSKIHLVDLAGSENAKAAGTTTTRSRLKEGSAINKSLLTLGRVIKALATNERNRRKQTAAQRHAKAAARGQETTAQPGTLSSEDAENAPSEGNGGMNGAHSTPPSAPPSAAATPSSTMIPYRDSVLTYLLKESLGGNARTTMIATIRPAVEYVDETMSTLRYASHAKLVVNKAVVNENPYVSTIKSLRAQVTALMDQLSAEQQAKSAVNEQLGTLVTQLGQLEELRKEDETRIEQLQLAAAAASSAEDAEEDDDDMEEDDGEEAVGEIDAEDNAEGAANIDDNAETGLDGSSPPKTDHGAPENDRDGGANEFASETGAPSPNPDLSAADHQSESHDHAVEDQVDGYDEHDGYPERSVEEVAAAAAAITYELRGQITAAPVVAWDEDDTGSEPEDTGNDSDFTEDDGDDVRLDTVQPYPSRPSIEGDDDASGKRRKKASSCSVS